MWLRGWCVRIKCLHVSFSDETANSTRNDTVAAYARNALRSAGSLAEAPPNCGAFPLSCIVVPLFECTHIAVMFFNIFVIWILVFSRPFIPECLLLYFVCMLKSCSILLGYCNGAKQAPKLQSAGHGYLRHGKSSSLKPVSNAPKSHKNRLSRATKMWNMTPRSERIPTFVKKWFSSLRRPDSDPGIIKENYWKQT